MVSCYVMHTPPRFFRLSVFFTSTLILLAIAANTDLWRWEYRVTQGDYYNLESAIPVQARNLAQDDSLAFPADSAGFSAYYRVKEGGSFQLDKGKVDDFIFSPISPEDTSVRTAPATLVSIGDNYTIARVSLVNIDGIVSRVNLYYDDEGWVVSYLPSGAPSSQIWQAREENIESPSVTDISLTTLLDTLNLVIADSLEKTAIDSEDAGLGYYHWQHPDADSFLMMAVSRQEQGEYPVQFSVPSTLTVSEVSATLWISQGGNPQAPCAKIVFDDEDLIANQCEKGIYSSTVDLTKFREKETHSWKLVQSERKEGASGGLMMIVYSTPE